MTIEEYLMSQYAQKKFRYFNFTALMNQFGTDGKKQLKELRKSGKIRSRKGANGYLVEIL